MCCIIESRDSNKKSSCNYWWYSKGFIAIRNDIDSTETLLALATQSFREHNAGDRVKIPVQTH
jgi:hypothetical protein